MNEAFYELPEEKRMRVINAGLEVFSRNEYKRASTEEIARRAGISKGLLFYYFHNKKSLYLFLYGYCRDMILNQVQDSRFQELTDYFELLEYAAEHKVKLLNQMPCLADFIVRCYYSPDEAVAGEVNRMTEETVRSSGREYFKNVDFTKFKDGVELEEIYEMLTWMMDGYIHSRQRAGLPLDLEEAMKKFYIWEARLKKIAYRDEYQTGRPL